MQCLNRALYGRMGRAVWTLLLKRNRNRGLQSSAKYLSEHEGLSAASDGPFTSASSGTCVTPQLHSVLHAKQGFNTFAVATVTFNALSAAIAQTSTSAAVVEGGEAAALVPAVQHAAQMALLALHGALGAHRPPSTLVVLPSLEIPRMAVRKMVEVLTSWQPGTAIVGCSSRLRMPDERRGVAASAASTATASRAAGDGGAVAPEALDGLPPARQRRFHITLAAAHLPEHEVVAVRCETGSLPRLPYLAEAIQGKRPPAFLLLAGSDSMAVELLARLENLFPGSVIGAGVAAEQRGRDRRLMLVGPGGPDGGGTAWPSDRAVPSDVGVAGAAASAVAAADTTAGIGDSFSSHTSPLSPTVKPDLEGHFQRMLLDRDGNAAAASGSSNSTGRRRRPPPPGTAGGRNTKGGGGDQGPPSSAADTVAAAVAAPDAEAVAAHVDELQTPFVMVGEEIHGSGGALLAVYPKQSTTAASRSSSPSAVVTVGRRLDTSACDLLARLALGNDLLQHVVLLGPTSSAISPPPTGPEPLEALPAASENPFYWHPARLVVPGLEVLVPEPESSALSSDFSLDFPSDPNPHSQQLSAPTPRLELWQAVVAATTKVGAAAATETETAATEAGFRAKDAWFRRGGQSGDVAEEVGEEVESVAAAEAEAAMMASLRAGVLSELPLFPLDDVILFPGQTIQLRIFEKRYRLLVRSCMQQGAAFGLCWRGRGTTAVVRSYHSPEQGDLLVLLEGGVRFSYDEEDLAVLPGSYGLNVTRRAEYVVDDAPRSAKDAAALVAAAHAVMDDIAAVLEEASTPSVQQTSRSFANALHFASSSSSRSSGSSSQPSAQGAPAAAAALHSLHSQQEQEQRQQRRQPSAVQQQQQQQQQQEQQLHSGAQPGPGIPDDGGASAGIVGGGSSGSSGSSGSRGHGAALLVEDLAEAKRAMDSETASLLSQYLAPHIPVHLESLRKEWFTSRNALWRLQQEAAWLRSRPRVAMAVATSVLRLPRKHPLRVMMGLTRVTAVEVPG